MNSTTNSPHDTPAPDVRKQVVAAAQDRVAQLPSWVKEAYAQESIRFKEMGDVARNGR